METKFLPAIRALHGPWSMGRTAGPKRPLWPKQVWAIAVRLELVKNHRDLSHTRMDSTVRYMAVELEDALAVPKAIENRKTSAAFEGGPLRIFLLPSVCCVSAHHSGHQCKSVASPFSRSGTILIFASAEYCSRAGGCLSRPSNRGFAWLRVSVVYLLLGGCDKPETLHYEITASCPIGAEVRQAAAPQQKVVLLGG
jgi:hypothetical protein